MPRTQLLDAQAQISKLKQALERQEAAAKAESEKRIKEDVSLSRLIGQDVNKVKDRGAYFAAIQKRQEKDVAEAQEQAARMQSQYQDHLSTMQLQFNEFREQANAQARVMEHAAREQIRVMEEDANAREQELRQQLSFAQAAIEGNAEASHQAAESRVKSLENEALLSARQQRGLEIHAIQTLEAQIQSQASNFEAQLLADRDHYNREVAAERARMAHAQAEDAARTNAAAAEAIARSEQQ